MMKERYYIILSLMCLLMTSCAAGVSHYYPPALESHSRNELVRLNSTDYPFIEEIDGQSINRYMRPLYIEPGPHRIVVRPRRMNYESDPVAITLNGAAGEVYDLSYSVEWSGKDRLSGIVSADAKLTGTSEPPPHPLIMRRNALVYIYRDEASSGVIIPVYLEDKPLQYLYSGSVCPILIRPGPAVFSLLAGKVKAAIDIEPDTVYYLKGGVGSGGVSLEQVDEAVGEQEIRKTWLNAMCNEVPRGYYPLVPGGR